MHNYTDTKIPLNNHLISLLNTFSKVFALFFLVLKLLLNIITIPEQFGFRAKHSASYIILKVIEFIAYGLVSKRRTLFLDFLCAFDYIWHNTLLYTLIILLSPDSLVRLIYSYLTNNTFCVKHKDTFSSSYLFNVGVP